MPIRADLLEQIRTNTFTSKVLNLRHQKLEDADIPELVSALAANSRITFLDVSFNQIGDVGAKALAAANTTITTLDISHNEIGDKGVKALAANTAITTLDISDNQGYSLDVSENKIGDEGAKAFVANTTLTNLHVGHNQISDEWQKHLRETIRHNNRQNQQYQQLIKRRDQFTQKLMILANGWANEKSPSPWSHLPLEIILDIIRLIDFRSSESIGKSAQQIMACAEFIFSNTQLMNESLTESSKTKQSFKVMEKITDGKSEFRFFPSPKPQIKSPENLSTQEKNMEQLIEDSKVTEKSTAEKTSDEAPKNTSKKSCNLM